MNLKILVVAGPNRGATYFLQEGENVFGRGTEASIVLASTQVSKKHCVIVCNGAKAEVSDAGSSNGTFVNGVQIKKRLLQNHDRISAGPFVLEVIMPDMPVQIVGGGGVGFSAGAVPGAGGVVPPVTIDAGHFKMEEEQPTGLIGRYKQKFDNIFLPVVYDFYERTDYATMLVVMFAIYAILSLGFSVYPVLQRSREEVLRQAEHQAKYIADQVAYLNRQAILEGRENALMTDFAESETFVQEVVVANLEGRIMAPGSRLNEIFQNPYFLKYRDLLQKKQEYWGKSRVIRLPDKDLLIAFTPIMVMSKTKGINVPGAIATVIYSTASIALDPGTIGTVYLEALFWSIILGVVFLYLIFHMTYKPIYALMDDMNNVLKGEGNSVEKKYKNEILDQLVDIINSALGRIPRADGKKEDIAAGDQEQLIITNMMRSIEFLAMKAGGAMMLLDLEMRIQAVNPAFEELTGMRGCQGETIDTASRDESFPSLIKEMAGKAADAGNDGVQEDYDFQAGQHKISAMALSSIPGKVESYVFIFDKVGD
ncbi:MAG: FHA domain-containing protein [Bdellovibrionota bacterium]